MEWTDEFITNAQHELTAMVQDWKYDYGADDRACVAMLLWMVLRLRPNAEIDPELLRIVLGIASSTGVRNDVTTDG